MPNAPKKSETKIQQTLQAWESLRSTKSYAGMTLEEFKAKVQPSFDARVTIANLENQLLAAQNQRDNADKASLSAITLVVNAVKGDPEEGDDGDFYEALGYIRRSERKSGLSQTKTATTESAPAA